MLGVTKVEKVLVLSVCNSVPPELAVYQRIVPADGLELEAAIVTVPVPQRDPLTAVSAVGVELTLATTGKRGLVHAGLAVVIET
jgi:hypothetical protein